MIKNMFEIVDYAIASKRFVGGLGRLKKDGSIVKLNGQVFERRTTKNGDEVILLDNFLGNYRKGKNKRWQLVLMDNLVALNENHWRHTKAA
jgi:hypothetical protein